MVIVAIFAPLIVKMYAQQDVKPSVIHHVMENVNKVVMAVVILVRENVLIPVQVVIILVLILVIQDVGKDVIHHVLGYAKVLVRDRA